MKISSLMTLIVGAVALSLPACERLHGEGKEEAHAEHHDIIFTSAKQMDVVITQRYVCRIRSQRHIEIKALQEGYLMQIPIMEGEAVEKDKVLFRVIPAIYKARFDAEQAEAKLANIRYENTKRLFEQKVGTAGAGIVSDQEVAQYAAELAKANAKVALADAELKFATVKAPFAGIIDRLRQQEGSLVKKEEVLTTLSDNSKMWVYFNVPEARYLEYKALQKDQKQMRQLELANSRIELKLADGRIFNHDPGNVVTVEGEFNFETGNIPFRSDFLNSEGLLRNGQTGTILVHRTVPKAIVIPQRATFEILDKQYVWVVGADHVIHQRPITIAHELEDKFVISGGLSLEDIFVLKGVRQVNENDKMEDVKPVSPDDALTNMKYRAE